MLNILPLLVVLTAQGDQPTPQWIWSKNPAGERDVIHLRRDFGFPGGARTEAVLIMVDRWMRQNRRGSSSSSSELIDRARTCSP